MEEDRTEVKIDEIDVNNIRRSIESSSSRGAVGFIVFLLLLLTAGIGYLCYNTYRETHATETMDSSKRILVVSIESDLADSDRSDKTQVNNALENGGMIRLKNSSEGFEYSLGTVYKRYGASDSQGYMWLTGAVLNYVASRGWTFTQGPSSGLSNQYFFVK